jgi:hypothetical protein
MGDAKTYLENTLYQKAIDSYCGTDSRNIRTITELQSKVALAKRHNVLMAGRCFDLHEYPGYSLGQREFQIQRVSLLQRNQDFVILDTHQQ